MTKIVLNPKDKKRLLKAVIIGEIETQNFPKVWNDDLYMMDLSKLSDEELKLHYAILQKAKSEINNR